MNHVAAAAKGKEKMKQKEVKEKGGKTSYGSPILTDLEI